MRIGLDFDNTIVCYDQAIALLAEEMFELPEGISRSKLALRDFLRNAGREEEWTNFQGELYGPGMRYAQPYEEAKETMESLTRDGHELVIVSHRTKKPYKGNQYDLHLYARKWIRERLKGIGGIGKQDKNKVFFMESQAEKIEQIRRLSCDVFVDDLPEVLTAKDFPRDTTPILFQPDKERHNRGRNMFAIINSWSALNSLL